MNKFQFVGLAWLYLSFFFLAWVLLFGIIVIDWTVFICGFIFWVACLLIGIHLYQKGETYAKHS